MLITTSQTGVYFKMDTCNPIQTKACFWVTRFVYEQMLRVGLIAFKYNTNWLINTICLGKSKADEVTLWHDLVWTLSSHVFYTGDSGALWKCGNVSVSNLLAVLSCPIHPTYWLLSVLCESQWWTTAELNLRSNLLSKPSSRAAILLCHRRMLM